MIRSVDPIVAVLSARDKNSVLIANSVYRFGLKLPEQPAATSFTNLPLRLVIPSQATTIRVAVRDVDPSRVKTLIAQHR
jgi:hypothetical protein